jgi:hypothetical protein
MKIFRLVLINFLIFLFLIIGLEVFLRSSSLIINCTKNNGEFSSKRDCIKRFTGTFHKDFEFNDLNTLYIYDKKLGYKFRKNTLVELDGKYFSNWDTSSFYINKDGFRTNGNNKYPKESYNIIFGDSFIFGDQVKDNETISSCLEENLKQNFINAGVTGYGTLQSYLYLKDFLDNAKNKPQIIILQTLVYTDFLRDRLIYSTGFPVPSLEKNDNEFSIKFPENKFHWATKFSKGLNPFYFDLMIEIGKYSFLFNKLIRYSKLDLKYKKYYSKQNPNAASVEEIADWVLEKYSKIKLKKFFLLQYRDGDKYSKEVIDFRKKLIKILNKYDINYIDTFDEIFNLKNYNELYFWHHNKKGNKFVCNIILKNI